VRDALHNCRQLPSLAKNFSRSKFRLEKWAWKQYVSRIVLSNYTASCNSTLYLYFINKSIIKFGCQKNWLFVHANPLLLVDGWSQHGCQHAAAADCGHTSCRSADRQHDDHRAAAHSPVCVDRRTQIIRTRKTPRLLAATDNDGRQTQCSQYSCATEGPSADGERHIGKVTRGNKMAYWTVPIKRRWHCRHITFTPQLHSVCVERRRTQLKRDAWKSVRESEIQYIVEPSRKVFCGGNWHQQWTSTITGCSHMFHIVAVGQNCQRGGLDPKPICISSTACYEHHKYSPGCFTLRERSYCTLAGLATGTVCTGTEYLSFRFYPRNVQLVRNRYTDWANTAHRGDRYRE